MIQTFTPALDITVADTEKESKNNFFDLAEPSNLTIQNILNYSKNLEVKQSRLIREVELMKS